MTWGIIEFIAPLILNQFDGCIVEVGSGASTHMFNQIAGQKNVKFYSCDIREKKGATEKKSKLHIPMIMSSFEFMKVFNDTPAIVFLDGCHDYDVVSKEFYFFYEKLVPGGVLFIHDTLPDAENFMDHCACSDVYKLRLEIEKNPNIDIVTWPHPICGHGLSMIFKKYRHNNYSPPGECYD